MLMLKRACLQFGTFLLLLSIVSMLGACTPVDTTPPEISSVVALSDIVYYPEGCGDNILNIGARILDHSPTGVDPDPSRIEEAHIRYRYMGDDGYVGGWHTQAGSFEGMGSQFGFYIDVGSEASAELGTQNGTIEYQVFATDISDNTAAYPDGSLLGVPVNFCAAVLDLTPPTIHDVMTLEEIVYYPTGCGDNILSIGARILDPSPTGMDPDPSRIAEAYARYRYMGEDGYVGGWHILSGSFEGMGSQFGFYINVGSEASAELGTQDGTVEFQIFATDTSGNSAAYPDGSLLGRPVIFCPAGLSLVITPGFDLTPRPEITPDPRIPIAVILRDAACRSGPSLDHPVVDYLTVGMQLQVLGSNQERTWWYLLNLRLRFPCWASGNLLDLTGDLEGLPVQQYGPPPVAVPSDTPAPSCFCCQFTSQTECNQHANNQCVWNQNMNVCKGP